VEEDRRISEEQQATLQDLEQKLSSANAGSKASQKRVKELEEQSKEVLEPESRSQQHPASTSLLLLSRRDLWHGLKLQPKPSCSFCLGLAWLLSSMLSLQAANFGTGVLQLHCWQLCRAIGPSRPVLHGFGLAFSPFLVFDCCVGSVDLEIPVHCHWPVTETPHPRQSGREQGDGMQSLLHTKEKDCVSLHGERTTGASAFASSV
jgi:hypothetical protein